MERLSIMGSSREHQCIKAASEARIASAQRRLDNLRDNGMPFDSPLSGFTWGIEWKDRPGERIKQILLFPVAFILITFLALMVPVAHLMHQVAIHKKKQNLKKEITDEEVNPDIASTPKIKTLGALWQLHGLDEYKHSSDERVELLSKWLEILYEKNVVVDLDINNRVKAIAASHVEANRPYYEGQNGAAHFHFVSPVESLIRELSEELPEYDEIA